MVFPRETQRDPLLTLYLRGAEVNFSVANNNAGAAPGPFVLPGKTGDVTLKARLYELNVLTTFQF